MKAQDLEIPYANERTAIYRFFEMLPGLLSLTVLLIPVLLSIFYITAAAFFIIAYVLALLIRAAAMSVRVIEGYGNIKKARKVDWESLLKDFYNPKSASRHAGAKNSLIKDHISNMKRLESNDLIDMLPSEVVHAVIIATYNESQEIIHPTIDYIINTSGFKNRKIALFIAYEERADDQKKRETLETVSRYKSKFFHMEAVEHKLLPGEIPGKGANATNTGRHIAKWAKQEGVDPSKILITTLDADNRPDKNFFSVNLCIYIGRKPQTKVVSANCALQQ